MTRISFHLTRIPNLSSVFEFIIVRWRVIRRQLRRSSFLPHQHLVDEGFVLACTTPALGDVEHGLPRPVAQDRSTEKHLAA